LIRCIEYVHKNINSFISSPAILQNSVDAYLNWRARSMEAKSSNTTIHDKTSYEYSRTISLLQQDERICRYFYFILLLIQAAVTKIRDSVDITERLRPPGKCNYRLIKAIRKKKLKEDAENDLIRLNVVGSSTGAGSKAGEVAARIRLNKHSLGIRQSNPVFRDVVEEYAREKDILFQPKFGSNTTKDGKQIFLFGPVQVYLDDDVVFALQDGRWSGIALDSLAKYVQQTEPKYPM
jgi:hypothetical protein